MIVKILLLILVAVLHATRAQTPPTPVTADTVTTALEVIDENDAVKTSAELGDPARLRVTIEVTPYAATTSIAGARVTNCDVSKDITFTAGQTVNLIDSNGCFVDTDQFQNTVAGTGFGYNGITAVDAPSKLTFSTKTALFELSSFQQPDVGVASTLYFRCQLQFCFDNTDTTLGRCGGNNCSGGKRRRRSEVNSHGFVTANVTMLPPKTRPQNQECEGCGFSAVYKATVGAMGTIAALLFAGMLYSYTSTRDSILRRGRKFGDYNN